MKLFSGNAARARAFRAVAEGRGGGGEMEGEKEEEEEEATERTGDEQEPALIDFATRYFSSGATASKGFYAFSRRDFFTAASSIARK